MVDYDDVYDQVRELKLKKPPSDATSLSSVSKVKTHCPVKGCGALVSKLAHSNSFRALVVSLELIK